MPRGSVLIVEDDPSLQTVLSRVLREAGYVVQVAGDGLSGKAQALALKPDVLLLDLGLPELPGMSVLEAVQGLSTRVCIMTAEDAHETKMKAFAIGSDDYLVKPFNTEELLARVGALMRRSVRKQSALIVQGLTIHSAAPLVEWEGITVQLPPMEHRLLVYLAERPGVVVSRSELLDEVWSSADRYPNTVDVHVENLRKKLVKLCGKRFIQTAYRQGYFFE